MIIQGDMLSHSETTKYIAISKDNSDIEAQTLDRNVPLFMRSKYFIKWEETEENFNELLSMLFDVNLEPPLGQIPSWILEKTVSPNTQK